MNTHLRRNERSPLHEQNAARRVHGATKWCVALVCAGALYAALRPATLARAQLADCTQARLAALEGDTSVRPTHPAKPHAQAMNEALYACSTQP